MPSFVVILAGLAIRDAREILDWSEREFGDAAALRYEALLAQALIDLGENPQRAGAKRRLELPPEIYTYHLAYSRDRVVGDRVKQPRHFLAYRVVAQRVEVVRILHDSRDLARHLPAGS